MTKQIKKRKVALLSVAFLFFVLRPALACESEFPNFNHWLQLHVANSSDLKEVMKQRREFDEAQEQAAHELAREYLAGKDLHSFWTCLKASGRDAQFLPAMSRYLFQDTLEQLKTTSPLAARFANQIEKHQAQMLLFSAVERPPIEGAPANAGFHRGSGSVYMNLNNLNATEWPLIFSHELAHALDSEMKTAIRTYSHEEMAKTVASWVHNSDTSSPPPELDEFLVAGLNRGLLAEHRAWTLSMELYLEAKKAGTWARIAWIEDLLSQRNPGERLDAFVYRYLDQHFKDPNEGIFSLPPVQRRLQELRDQYRNKPPVIGGTIGELLRGH